MKQLNEKVAIVTGAGQGIGKGIALVLARRGVKVVCTGRRLEPIEQTVAEIKAEGGEGFAMTCDSGDRARVEEVVAKAVELYGSIDVIVNNGQAIVPSASVEDTTYENMLGAWQSGTIGSLNYMQAAFPYMKEQNEGRIINFASATGMFESVLRSTIDNVKETEAAAVEAEYLMATGQLDNPATLLIAQTKSNIAVELLVQMRNKAMEAYSEITNINM